MVVRSSKGNVVGRIEGDVLSKSVKSSKHMLRNPPSWGFDKSIIDKAFNAGVKVISILDKDTGVIYKITMDKFLRNKFDQNRGFGEQCFVPIDRWAVAEEQQGMF